MSKGVKRCQEVSRDALAIVRRCLQASKSANMRVKECQKVSEGMKRCLDNCLGVSGDVYRHSRVPIYRCFETCVKRCQEVSREVLTIVLSCQELSTVIQECQ